MTNTSNPLFRAALELQDYFFEQTWSFCFIGGLAVLRWGEFRMTEDIDAAVLTGIGPEPKFVKALLQQFESRVDAPEDFALQNRVLLLKATNGVNLDISLAALPFEELMIQRATFHSFDEQSKLLTCSAEDLVVLKAFAARMKDWNDIDSVIIRYGADLNHAYILEQLTPLVELKEEPEILEKLNQLFATLSK